MNTLAMIIDDLQILLRDETLRGVIAIGCAAIVMLFIVPPLRKLMIAVALATLGVIALIVIIDALAKSGLWS